ncbi:MAG: MATE family efflux transporter [Thermoanaerobaculia bacterium]
MRNELRELFRLAAPLAAAQAGSQLMGIVDVAVLGRYGARELAAAGIGNAIFFAISVLGMGIVLGIDPLVSQAVGAGDPARARRVLWQGVWLSLAVSAVLTVALIGAAVAMPIIGTPELIAPARAFLLIRTAGLVPFLLFFAVRAYLQAHGITRPMVIAMAVANVVNLAGDILLVFGYGPIPPLGVAGAALATVACTFLQLAIVVAAVKRLHVPGPVDHSWDAREVNHAFRVGLPVGLHMGAEVGVFALVALLAGRLGTMHLAAHQVVINLASFTFTVAVGVASAGSVRVGLAIGSRDPVATRTAGHVAFLGGALVMGVGAAVFALFPAAMARLLTNRKEIIAASIPLMIVAAVFQLSDGVQAAGAGVLRGAGDTRFVFYANIVGHWLIGLPIALYLGFTRRMGIVGLWWGLCVGLTVVAVLLYVRFERLSRDVIEPLAHARE